MKLLEYINSEYLNNALQHPGNNSEHSIIVQQHLSLKIPQCIATPWQPLRTP